MLMNDTQKRVIALIEAQQKPFSEYSTVRMVGEQLKDIAWEDPACAELLEQDLQKPGMKIADAEKKIHARADELHGKAKGGSIAIPPAEAERILRSFYGLPERKHGREAEKAAAQSEPKQTPNAGKIIDLADFL